MLTDNTLKSKVDALWNRFWSGGISNPLTAIEQMSYLIFLKRLEDIDNANAAAAKRRKLDFKSVFNQRNQKCKWSYWSQLPGDEMLKHVRDVVFEFLRNLGSETSSFTQHMEDAMFSIPKASLLQEAVKIIDDMHISEQNIDVQGDLYEYLLGQLSTAGKNGQFRTPRHIIRMMTKLVNPKPGERICDPAAGTAGFLVAAYEHMLETNTSKDILTYDDEGKAHNLIGDKISPELHKFLKGATRSPLRTANNNRSGKDHSGEGPGVRTALNGYDFDATMVRMGAMNLMLHGVDNPNFRYTDALSKQFSEKQCYDVILANPPFKGSIDESDINPRFAVKTKKTELLFVELIYDLLESGGRAAVIVPDGVLFGTSNAHQGVREILVDRCKLDGIISMPAGVFRPYAGVSTAVLIFTKSAMDKDYDVWFYDMHADGFSMDDKRQKVSDNDIPDILEKWNSRHLPSPAGNKNMKKNAVAGEGPGVRRVVIVNTKEIKKNKYDLSISRYKPVEHNVIEYEKPEVLMDRVMMLEEEIVAYVKAIKKEI